MLVFFFLFKKSKRISDGEMPCKLIGQVGASNGPFAMTDFLRVVGFHSRVKTNQKIIEVKSHS